MAVTITRTSWIDDDGTGTSGTVINNAEKTTIYNQIDAALAQLAQLAGGNAFTGNQGLSGNFVITGSASSVIVNAGSNPNSSKLFCAADATTSNGISVQNTHPSIPGLNFFSCLNSTAAIQGAITGTSLTSVAYNTTSDARLKDDDGPATDLTALRAVAVHDFTWKLTGLADRGVFAQNTHAVFPRAVTRGTDETTASGTLAHPWMTDYSKFVPDLIVGWQQHDAAIADLRALLATVKGSF